jgi:hypothetical protein
MASPSSTSAPPSLLRSHDRWRRAAPVLLLGLLAAVMLATVSDYGMTGDEGVQHRYARRVLRWYATLGADRSAAADEDISMYGAFFETAAEAAAAAVPLDPYAVRHVVTVLFALGAVVAAHGMGSQLAGRAGGMLSAGFLVLTPLFYGHAFNNPKDIPFAATFAVAAWAILAVSERSPRLSARDVLVAAAAIGATAGVRVAGIALFGFALLLWGAVALQAWRTGPAAVHASSARDLGRLVVGWLAVVAGGWGVMVAFWPWAQVAPLANPLRALRAFSRFWETMIVFYDGRYVPNGEVSRFYVPKWLALTLPETYAIAAVLGALAAWRLWRRRPLASATRRRLVQAGWLGAVAFVPVAWAVVRHTPVYDGPRHFLFVVPLLAVMAGTATAAGLRASGRVEGRIAAALLAGTALLTGGDMVALHPYEALYFNRSVAGGLRRAVDRYDTDYWCLSYKEGAEWLLARFAGARCTDKIRVAGHSIVLQTSYYLRKTEEGRRLFSAVSLDDDPNFAMATTRFGDQRNTPGRLVHTVEREGATLLYVFEVKPPACLPGE